MNVPHLKHKPRYYIVILTIIIVGAFLFYTLNNPDKDINDIKGAIKNNEGSALLLPKENVEATGDNNEISFVLSFDAVPEIEKEISFTELQLQFDDPEAAITINGDRLELNSNEDTKILDLREGNGKITLNENSISLEITARRIEVNNVALSSEKDIELSFKDSSYLLFDIRKINLDKLIFPSGNGEFTITDKLSYVVESGSVSFTTLSGNILIDKSSNQTVIVEGTSQEVSIGGETLDIDLH